jgi:acetyl esterase/lipase
MGIVSRHRPDPLTEVLERRKPLPRRARRWTLAGLIAAFVVVAVSAAVMATPWPSAMLIRSVFTQGGEATVQEMIANPPADLGPVDEKLDQAMGVAGGPGTGFDVFMPADADGPVPTVVWVHGGAWISGSKEDVAPYLRYLAGRGYGAVGLDYTRGPEATYPTAVNQLNDSLAYLVAHADEYGIDADHLVIAGDSAGGQLASQLGVLTVNERYADLLGIEPALKPGQLSGLILNCGVYDMDAMAELDGIFAWGFDISLWAYTGTKNWSSDYIGATMSTIDFVTDDLPPTFISGGNHDALTWIESVPMASALKEAGVETTALFWPADYEPELPHEYQFHLHFDAAQQAFEQTVDFLDEHAAK